MRKTSIVFMVAGLLILAIALSFAAESGPTFSAYDTRGTAAFANVHSTGKITVGVEAQGDTLDINLGFVPTVFECWVAANDSAAEAKHFLWFTGMKDGTALTNQLTGGVVISDSIVQGGITPLAGAAADTVVAYNTYVMVADSAATLGASGGPVITGVRLGAAVLVDSLLFFRAVP